MNMIEALPNASVILTLTRENEESGWNGSRGRFDKHTFKEILTQFNLKQTKFFMCGTPGFILGMKEILIDLGIQEDQILHEKWA